MVHRWSTLLVCIVVASAGLARAQGANKISVPTVTSTVDTSGGSPTDAEKQLLQQIADKAAEVSRQQYPMIVRTIGAEKNYQCTRFTITFTYAYKGVAGTDNDHTDVSADYALKHPNDIPGVMVHELTHVVQHYTHDSPGWLVEGIADFVRWYNYEPVSKRHAPHASRAKYDGSYQTSANFLDWAMHKYNKNLIKFLNQELYDGVYKDVDWTKLTGHTLEQLNAEWKETLAP